MHGSLSPHSNGTMVGLLRRHAQRQRDQALWPAALEYASDLDMRRLNPDPSPSPSTLRQALRQAQGSLRAAQGQGSLRAGVWNGAVRSGARASERPRRQRGRAQVMAVNSVVFEHQSYVIDLWGDSVVRGRVDAVRRWLAWPCAVGKPCVITMFFYR